MGACGGAHTQALRTPNAFPAPPPPGLLSSLRRAGSPGQRRGGAGAHPRLWRRVGAGVQQRGAAAVPLGGLLAGGPQPGRGLLRGGQRGAAPAAGAHARGGGGGGGAAAGAAASGCRHAGGASASARPCRLCLQVAQQSSSGASIHALMSQGAALKPPSHPIPAAGPRAHMPPPPLLLPLQPAPKPIMQALPLLVPVAAAEHGSAQLESDLMRLNMALGQLRQRADLAAASQQDLAGLEDELGASQTEVDRWEGVRLGRRRGRGRGRGRRGGGQRTGGLSPLAGWSGPRGGGHAPSWFWGGRWGAGCARWQAMACAAWRWACGGAGEGYGGMRCHCCCCCRSCCCCCALRPAHALRTWARAASPPPRHPCPQVPAAPAAGRAEGRQAGARSGAGAAAQRLQVARGCAPLRPPWLLPLTAVPRPSCLGRGDTGCVCGVGWGGGRYLAAGGQGRQACLWRPCPGPGPGSQPGQAAQGRPPPSQQAPSDPAA
jgi:hypothetical protein